MTNDKTQSNKNLSFVICHFFKKCDFKKVVGINRVGYIYNTESYILSKTVIFKHYFYFDNPNAR